MALDLESKFGKTAATSSSRIPSAAEIREKKDRRARLAKEQIANATTTTSSNVSEDFIPLEDYDSDGEFKPRRMQVGSYLPPAREKDTRLVRDDEDIAEGFDSFIEDSGRVTLSQKGLREQSRKEREEIRTLIADAEGGHSSGSDGSGGDGDGDSDSEYERHQAYETAQTHHGMDGLSAHAQHTRQAARPRQPRETTAIPKLSVGLSRLREMVSQLEFERARIAKRRADMHREKLDIAEQQQHIQTSLEEAGKELEKVRQGHARQGSQGANGGAGGDGPPSASNGNGLAPPQPLAQERGLESFGHTPENSTS